MRELNFALAVCTPTYAHRTHAQSYTLIGSTPLHTHTCVQYVLLSPRVREQSVLPLPGRLPARTARGTSVSFVVCCGAERIESRTRTIRLTSLVRSFATFVTRLETLPSRATIRSWRFKSPRKPSSCSSRCC